MPFFLAKIEQIVDVYDILTYHAPLFQTSL